jgi:hypothetical protein
MLQQLSLARARLTAYDDELRVGRPCSPQGRVEAGQLVVTADEVAHAVSLVPRILRPRLAGEDIRVPGHECPVVCSSPLRRHQAAMRTMRGQ